MVAAPARAAASDPVARRLAAYCEARAREGELSGAVLLAKDGAVLYRAAFGRRNRAEALPNRPDTRFNYASIGKLFTALAILRFAEQGRLGLDDRLAAHWPDYPNRAVAEAVTIRQLLAHTAGMGNSWATLATRPPQSVVTVADMLALFVDKPLSQPPGQGFVYSNDGYVILGGLIERLAGEPCDAHLRRTIWRPLGMAATAWVRQDEPPANFALGYARDLERPGVWKTNVFDNPFRGGPAGGGYSTVDDLFAFGEAMRRRTLLGPAMTEAWTRGVSDYARGRYGLGVSEATINGHRVIGHSGGHIGIAGELMVFEDLGYVAVVLTNGEVEAFWDLDVWIKRELCGEDAAARNHAFTRRLIDALAADAAAGQALYAARPEGVRARASVIDVYGFRLLHAGRAEAGLNLLRFNVEVAGDSSALWSWAEGLRLAGRREAARDAYRAYLGREPGDADAEARLKTLGG